MKKPIRIGLRIPKKLHEQIEEIRQEMERERGQCTFTQAVVELLIKGIKSASS